MSTPGVTSNYTLKSQPNTFKNSVLIYGVNTILGTSGCIPTRIRQQGRNTILIKFDEENGNYFKTPLHYLILSFKNDFPLIKPSIWSPILT
jgi:hypothetical protein